MITCSELARTLGEPLAGTAPFALAWIGIEQSGPWGPKALTDSHLDQSLGGELTARSAEIPLTIILLRRPGRHADDHQPHGPRSVYIAYCGTDGPWLVHAHLTPEALLDLDFSAIARGERPPIGDLETEQVILVCTNSKRDLCCALLGRPVAAALALVKPGRVWEASHTGGHRLAPTVMTLPDGYFFGGPQAETLSSAAARGRSSLGRAEQAAELAALVWVGSVLPRALEVTVGGPGFVVTDAVSGQSFGVRVTEQPLDPPRKESCLKGPVSSVAYLAHVEGSHV